MRGETCTHPRWRVLSQVMMPIATQPLAAMTTHNAQPCMLRKLRVDPWHYTRRSKPMQRPTCAAARDRDMKAARKHPAMHTVIGTEAMGTANNRSCRLKRLTILCGMHFQHLSMRTPSSARKRSRKPSDSSPKSEARCCAAQPARSASSAARAGGLQCPRSHSSLHSILCNTETSGPVPTQISLKVLLSSLAHILCQPLQGRTLSQLRRNARICVCLRIWRRLHCTCSCCRCVSACLLDWRDAQSRGSQMLCGRAPPMCLSTARQQVQREDGLHAHVNVEQPQDAPLQSVQSHIDGTPAMQASAITRQTDVA